MAKYQVTFSCGHTEQKELVGKGKERESRIAYWGENGLCTDCYKAEQDAKRARENAEAAQKAEAVGRANLQGSEKQVAWANTIRENIMEVIERAVRKDTEGGQKVHEYLNSKTDARFWIDNRDAKLNLKGFVVNIAKEIGLA